MFSGQQSHATQEKREAKGKNKLKSNHLYNECNSGSIQIKFGINIDNRPFIEIE